MILKMLFISASNSQGIVYCRVHCITSIIQRKLFLIKLFKNVVELIEDFFSVTGDSLEKTLSHPAQI